MNISLDRTKSFEQLTVVKRLNLQRIEKDEESSILDILAELDPDNNYSALK
jgi:hypothetical protein